MFFSGFRRAAPVAVLAVLWTLMGTPAWAAVTAIDDAAIAAEDTTVDIDVLANDFSDGSPPAVSAVSGPANGTAAIVGTMIRYSPDPGYSGPDTFSYDMTADGFTDTP